MKHNKISAKNVDFESSLLKLLIAMGEDPEREGLKNTPKRFDAAVKMLLNGYDRDFVKECVSFENRAAYSDIISLNNINFFSLCEHHLLPFFGYAHVAYIPSAETYLGISKLARAVDIFARRLQNQETLSSGIANAIMVHGKAKGVAILIEAKHLCSMARGVEKEASVMSTCAFYGDFKDNKELQQNFREQVHTRKKI